MKIGSVSESVFRLNMVNTTVLEYKLLTFCFINSNTSVQLLHPYKVDLFDTLY